VKSLLSIICLLVVACGHIHEADFAIRGVTLVDVTDGSLIPNQTVLIQGNQIVAVAAADAIRLADDADVLEAQGRYLIPGLWDMHVHSVRKVAVREEGSIDNVEWHFPLFLAYGVTGVRNMNDATADPTLELTNSVKRRLADGELLGPRLLDLVAYHHIVHADEILADTSSMRLVPSPVRRDWAERATGERFRAFQSILRPIIPLELENVRLLHEAGGTLLAATDAGVALQVPGISLHRQLLRLTEAGLTPLDALRTATLNPARVLGMEDSLGTIAAGKLADLVLLDANPLEDVSHTQRIRAVVADGRLYRRADLDQLLAEVEALN
jgi:hypothetical protein